MWQRGFSFGRFSPKIAFTGVRLKILIVDDNAPVRRLVASIVGPLAESIQEGSTGEEALAAYGSMRPDIVLMDIQMKEMDGIEATLRYLSGGPKRESRHPHRLRRHRAATSRSGCGHNPLCAEG